MNPEVYETLEYDKVLKLLAGQTVSGLGRELAERLEPSSRRQAVEAALSETSEAREILARGAQVPLWGLADLRPLLERVEKGAVLPAADVLRFADCLRGCRELKQYMKSKRQAAPRLAAYAERLTAFRSVEDEIYVSVDGARVADSASTRLAKVRKEIRVLEERIKSKLGEYLSSAGYRDVLQEAFVTIRDGRYALPVKASHRSRLNGHVLGTSGSGATVFVEPAAVSRLTDSLQVLKGEEQAEEYQVLVSLTGLISENARAIHENLEIMALFDLTFAKARLSLQMNAVSPDVAGGGAIRLVSARHPLLRGEVVPLDLDLGRGQRTLVITGPNTGGKTVALKTAGLLVLMAQAGLHVPAAQGTSIPLFDKVLADIGDAQSIEQSLSTFSGHITRIAGILGEAGHGSLVLLDEIGTGTDPAEGSALAMAILEELHDAGAVTVASTHYSDVKRLAEVRPGFVNGRMDFDRETLRPLYRLVMGEAGQSQALWIASRLGIGRSVLDRAEVHLAAAGRAGGDGDGAVTSRRPSRGNASPTARAGPGPGTGGAGPPRTGKASGAGKAQAGRAWRLGDSVRLLATGRQGVVAALPDGRGMLVVFSGGERTRIHERRVKLIAAAEDLYPEGYDLRTVLFTWKERKLMHDMQRKGDEVLGSSKDARWVNTGAIEVDRTTRRGGGEERP